MTINKKKLRICLVASAGGHLTELLKLSEVWKEHATFSITTSPFAQQFLSQYGVCHIVNESNRQHPFLLMIVFIKCLKHLFREKPNIIISTGAAPGCIACIIGKMLGAKIIWLDSIANVEKVSLSGRIIRHLADLFLVQWPELCKNNPKAEYLGAVI